MLLDGFDGAWQPALRVWSYRVPEAWCNAFRCRNNFSRYRDRSCSRSDRAADHLDLDEGNSQNSDAVQRGSRTIGAGLAAAAVVLSVLAVAQAPSRAGAPGPYEPSVPNGTVTMTLTGTPGLGNELLVVFNDGVDPTGSDFDLWFCPDQTIFPDDGYDDDGRPELNGECVGPFIQGQEGRSTTFTLTEADFEPEVLPTLCGKSFIVNDYLGGGHSNWLGPWSCGGDAAVPPSLTCTPDPVVPGGTVTCEVTGGDPNIDILWQASFDGAFASAGVRLDADGRGTFTFVAPRAASGGSVGVELVEWTSPLDVQVSANALPTTIPAGEGGSPVRSVLLGVLGLAGAALLVRRMGVAVG